MKCKREITKAFMDAVQEYQDALSVAQSLANYPRSMLNGTRTEGEIAYHDARLKAERKKAEVTKAANAITTRLENSKKSRVKFLDPCTDLVYMLQHCQLDAYQVNEMIDTYRDKLLGLRMLRQYAEAREMGKMLQTVCGYIKICEEEEEAAFDDSVSMTMLAKQVKEIREKVVINQDFNIDWKRVVMLDNS